MSANAQGISNDRGALESYFTRGMDCPFVSKKDKLYDLYCWCHKDEESDNAFSALGPPCWETTKRSPR